MVAMGAMGAMGEWSLRMSHNPAHQVICATPHRFAVMTFGDTSGWFVTATGQPWTSPAVGRPATRISSVADPGVIGQRYQTSAGRMAVTAAQAWAWRGRASKSPAS